jgi:hypothetical protein
MTNHYPHLDALSTLRDVIARAVAAVGLAGIGLIHLLDVQGKLQETPYLGWMYIGLIAASLGLAGLLVYTSDRRAWAGTAALASAVIVGYSLSRTTGLPGATDDIGNWTEPLGLASLFVEGSLVALSGCVLLARSRLAGRSEERRPERAGIRALDAA